MSDSVRPHRRQPTRLPHPWDSPGKNTGVGCHFLIQRMKVKSESEVSRVPLLATPWTAAYQAPLSMEFSRQEYWSGVPLSSPMMNLDSILKSRDITLLTKVCSNKGLLTKVFPVVMYGCDSWTIKKAEQRRIDAFKLYYKTAAIKWRRQWHPTPVLLPGKSHGRRSLVGCSPWDR